MKKKTIGIIVISLIIINFVCIGLVLSSGNEPGVRATTNKTSVREGEEFEVSILGNKICALDFALYYDSQKLQLTAPAEILGNWSKAEVENTYLLNSNNYEILDEEKTICKFRFKALENIVGGNTNISFTNVNITKEDTSTENAGDIVVPIQITVEEFTVYPNYSTTNLTNNDVTVSLVANKEVQDVDGWTKSADGKVLTKKYSNNIIESVVVKDIAGNEVIADIIIDNIDKTAPTLEVAYSTTDQTTEAVQVTITANEEIQNIDGWTRSSNNKVLTKSYSNNVEETVTVKDIAGNNSTANIKIDNISIPQADVTAPTVSVSYSTKDLTNQNVTVTITSDEEVQDISGWNKSNDGKVLTKSYSDNVEEVVVVKDNAGNETSTTIKIENIDKTGPVLGIEYSSTGLTNRDVQVTLTSNEAVQDVSGWTKSANGKVLTKTYSNNVDETVTVKDLVGNEVRRNIRITNIDKDAPTIRVTYDTTNLANGEVVVTITSNEEVQNVSGWTKSSDGKSLMKVFEDNTNESITVKDIAGNEAVANIRITNIDKIAPNVSVSYSTRKPTMRNVVVTLTSDEPVQDIIEWTKSSNGKVLTKSYENNIEEYLKVKDLAGNETTVEIIIANINNAAPSTDTTTPGTDTTDPSTDTTTPSTDTTAPRLDVVCSTEELTNENVKVTITSNEAVQDVDGWTKSSDGKVLIKDYSSNEEETITIKDLAGNETIVEIKIDNIDKEAPQLDVEYSTTEPTNRNVEVTITSNEEVQELNGWAKSSNGKALTKEFSENVEDTITIKDLAGNEITKNIKIENIDKTAPIINLRYSITRPVNGDVEAIITSNEEVQEVDGWIRSVNGKQLTKTFDKNTNEEVVIKDLLGNETRANIKIDNIDKTAPNVSVRYSTTEPTSEDVQVIITSNEELQDIDGWVKSDKGKMLTRTYTNNVEETITLKDIVGNEQNVEIVIRNITHYSDGDNVPTIIDVSYTTVGNKVRVVIQSNNELQELDGWELSRDKKTLTKEYDKNVTEEVVVKDINGNQKVIKIVITSIPKIDDDTGIDIDTNTDSDTNTINNNTINENIVNDIDDNNTTVDNKTNENRTNSTDKQNSIVENKDAGKHDNTMSDEELPYTGNTIKFMVAIGLISVFGIVLYVKFKKEYEGV